MRRVERSSRILLAGALVSAGVHAAIALGFVRWSQAAVLALSSRTPEPPAERERARRAPEPPERKPPVVRLGLENSEAATMTWLGFEKPTEHEAEQGTVEQSAMTLADPGPRQADPAPPAPEKTPEPAQPDQNRASPEARSAPAAPPTELPPDSVRELAQSVNDVSQRLAEAQEKLVRAIGQIADAVPMPVGTPELEGPPPPPPSRQQEPAAPKPAEAMPPVASAPPPAPAPRPAMAPSHQNAAASAGAGGLPGIKSDKESMAVSLKKAMVVRPGQVAAGQGLEIQTRQPRWTYMTMLTRSPRNPTVRITFGRDGKVRLAEFVSDGATLYNTGFDDVDQPLLDAIYGWTAKGKAINELKADDPTAGVTILMTVILRN